ncbi:MAG: CinA family protein [Actinomycetes bacterium]
MQRELIAMASHLGVTIATAESLTAGLVASKLAEVPGASAVLRGGIVAYATDIKGSVLGLDPLLLEHVVSEPVAAAMASGATRVLSADIGVSTTGVAGPDPLDGQPPGTVWLAAYDARNGRSKTKLLAIEGDRDQIREKSADAAIALAMELLSH